MARILTEINLPRPSNFLLGVEQQLFPLRDPARSARNREEHREHRHGKAHGLIDQTGIEVDVWIELALDEVFVFESDALALQSDLKKWILAHQVKNFI